MERCKDNFPCNVESKINFVDIMNHELLMQRCLHLAKLGQGNVAPNPMVGALLLHDDKIIGEGWHRLYGQAHAEVNAINEVKDNSLLTDCTLYVNLEPCSHYGKTPPCTDYIISNGIKKVVLGMIDPFAAVNGMGVQLLRNAGIDVTVKVLENECKELNKRFITFHSKKRPYIILKWAQSADGIIGRNHERIIISNKLSNILTHQWRSEEQAIMIGTNTVITDNPQLNVRHWFGNNPLRISIDKGKKFSSGIKLLDGLQPTLLFTYGESARFHNVEYEQIKEGDALPEKIISSLYKRNIQSLLVEGGKHTIESFIAAGLWDEARVFQAPQKMITGVKAPEHQFALYTEETIGDNKLFIYKN